MTGEIFDIKHFAVHDGPGIRTTVFFKGCPLKCVWCHNPEGISTKRQLGFIEHKCVNCGNCSAVCPTDAHSMKNGIHVLDRSKCILCGKCTSECRANALLIYGKVTDANSLIKELVEDADFYRSSNGGVTLSGGECLIQADFCAELLRELKIRKIHTAVDTCGCVSRQAFDRVIEYTDLFLYDIKAIDEDVHIKCTGYSNKIILENLKYIDSKNKKTEIRYPYVPNYNSGQAKKIAEFARSLKNIVKISVLPYHNYAASKYKSLSLKNTLPTTLPSDKELEAVNSLFTKIQKRTEKNYEPEIPDYRNFY